MTLYTLPKTEPAGHASQLTALQPIVGDGNNDDDDDDENNDVYDDDGFLLVLLK